MESIRAPIMLSRAIIEFKENSPALWSLINLNLSDRGFGAEWMGWLYIPGNKPVPNPSEYLCSAISVSLCDLRKPASRSVFVRRSEKSHVTGSASNLVCAHGQNPSLSAKQTESVQDLF